MKMNRSLYAVILVGCLLFSSNHGFCGDWPQWRGLNRDGHSTDTELLKKWPAGGPELLWKVHTVGGGYSTPSVANGRIYLLGDKEDACRIFALRESDGAALWNVELGKPGGHKKYPGPRSTPTVDGNKVYCLTQNGDLFCLAVEDGKVLWQKNLERDFQGKMMSGWLWSESLLIDGNRLLCTPGGSEGAVLALDKNNGKVLWRCKELTDPASYSSILPWDYGTVPQYVQLTGESVVGIEADTGKLLWQGPRKGKVAVVTTPVIKDDMIFVTSAYNIGCNMFKVKVSGKEFSAEEVYANKELMNHHGGVVRVDDHIYGTSKGLVCMEMATGKVAWEEKCVGKGAISYADGMLIVRSENKPGTIALVKADPGNFQEVGRFDQPDRSEERGWPHPVIANGRLYLRDQDLLLCYDIKKQ